jgi:hypothetical protein
VLAMMLAITTGGVWAQQSPQAPSPKKTAPKQRKKSHKTVAPVNQLPPQIMPPIPATLMNTAPVKPKVTMESGLLTIDAPNSTLSDVLSGVHNVTGAAIEGASPTERVAVKLGPGNPEQVLAALLRGTPYDYVILGALGRQDVVTRVLLTQQTVGQPGQSSPRGPGPRPETRAPQPTDDHVPTASDDAAFQAGADREANQTQQPAQPQADQNPAKTPEQLFKELQQLEQQGQQQK